MTRFSNVMGIVVPTKDRPEELARLLTSIRAQTQQPRHIVIVDGGDDGSEAVASEFSDLPIRYLRVHPPSLTKQKNVGVRAVESSATLIACIDDDIVLEDNALETMLEFWERASTEVGGACFNEISRPPATSWMQRLFLMDNRVFGAVTPSGYNTPIVNAKETRPSQWLRGGATVWRKDIFQEYSFNEWFLGSGLIEDLYFSYLVGRRYDLYVVAEAPVRHMEPPASWTGNYRIGKVQVINRVYFVRSNSDLSLAKCLWSLSGQTLANLASGLMGADTGRLLRACGNIAGFARVITGRTPRIAVNRATPRPSASQEGH